MAGKIPTASVLVVLAAFLAGAGTGAGLYASFGRPHRHPPGGHDGRRHLPPFLDALDLKPEQRTAIEAIIEKYNPRFEAIFKENAPKLQALRAEMDAEMVPVLDEEQRAKFEEIKKRRDERGPGFGPPPGMPPPGGPGGPPPPPPN